MTPAFSDPVFDSQRVFRQILDAMAQPGHPQQLSGAPQVGVLNPATIAIALTLLDFETTLWLEPALTDEQARDYLRFHCNCPITAKPQQADFAIISKPADMPTLQEFKLGNDEYPDRSSTLIIQVDSISSDRGIQLSGPGIETSREVDIQGLPDTLWDQLQQSRGWFPRGVDVLFTHDDLVLALPRTTQFMRVLNGD